MASRARELRAEAYRLASETAAKRAELATATSGDEPFTVLVVGGGGREHALAWKLAQSPRASAVFVAPGNGGTGTSGGKVVNVPQLSEKDHEGLLAFALEKDVGLVVVGPEAPLAAGLADALSAAGVACFGPSAAAARIEASKAFSKRFMASLGVRTARFRTFRTAQFEEARAYVAELAAAWGGAGSGEVFPIVLKTDGLAAGKGVLLPESAAEAERDLRAILLEGAFGSAGEEVLVEERLEGEEVSLLGFCDGTTVAVMPPAQDHKRALDGDLGPNTGGMGAYAPAPAYRRELSPAQIAEAEGTLHAIVRGMASAGTPYVGTLYAGLMLTKAGPAVIEYNCRFGDPETQVLLPLLKSDLVAVMLSCCDGSLAPESVEWHEGRHAATVVAAAPGYPGSYPKGLAISGCDAAAATGGSCAADGSSGTVVFHAGTKLAAGEGEGGGGGSGSGSGSGGLVTSGGRVLAVTSTSGTLRAAVDGAYSGIGAIAFEGMQYRRDIAHRALPARKPLRVAVLGSTRGSSMQPIIDAIAAGRLGSLEAEIVLVVSNKADAGIVARAAEHGIPCETFASKGRSREAFDADVTRALEGAGADVVLLIGFMRILSDGFVARWAGRLLNVHPSLLPAFAGGMDLAVHEAVLAASPRPARSGCTVHFVTAVVDGGPIAAQLACDLEADETAASLKAKVQALEGQAFLQSLRDFAAGALAAPIAQCVADAGVAAAAAAAPAGGVTYADAGVSITAGNDLVDAIKPLVKATRRPGCDADLGGFGGIFDLAAAGYDAADTLLVGCNDGVGTKLKVAIAVEEHRAASGGAPAGVDCETLVGHATVGIDLVAMCVNDLIVQGAEPLFFLDYYATGKLEPEVARRVVAGIAAGCRESGCGLIGGETAEMPSMYAAGEYDLAGFSVGAVPRAGVLPRTEGGDPKGALSARAGDVMLGLASTGVHSNGFSLVRKLVEMHGLRYSDPAPFEGAAPGATLGDVLLAPTRIYVKSLMPLIKTHGPAAGPEADAKGRGILALCHITGGGFTENLPRVLSDGVAADVDLDAWALPPVFRWLAKLGNLAPAELLRTYNCGMGMVVVVDAAQADEIMGAINAAEGNDDYCRVIGRLTERGGADKEHVRFSGKLAL